MTLPICFPAFRQSGRALAGQDVARLFQPYLAFLAVMLALGLCVLIA